MGLQLRYWHYDATPAIDYTNHHTMHHSCCTARALFVLEPRRFYNDLLQILPLLLEIQQHHRTK
jgi:hypothetical protein